jgi:hypothetical protein
LPTSAAEAVLTQACSLLGIAVLAPFWGWGCAKLKLAVYLIQLYLCTPLSTQNKKNYMEPESYSDFPFKFTWLNSANSFSMFSVIYTLSGTTFKPLPLFSPLNYYSCMVTHMIGPPKVYIWEWRMSEECLFFHQMSLGMGEYGRWYNQSNLYCEAKDGPATLISVTSPTGIHTADYASFLTGRSNIPKWKHYLLLICFSLQCSSHLSPFRLVFKNLHISHNQFPGPILTLRVAFCLVSKEKRPLTLSVARLDSIILPKMFLHHGTREHARKCK